MHLPRETQRRDENEHLEHENWQMPHSIATKAENLETDFIGASSKTQDLGFFTQTVAPCRVELSDDEGDDDLEGEKENYIWTLLDEDGRECGQRWPTARALAAHQRHTQGRTHGEPK